jgi:transposase InsO family protein
VPDRGVAAVVADAEQSRHHVRLHAQIEEVDRRGDGFGGQLNEHWFTSLDDATAKIEKWRQKYNQERPHCSLGGLTPFEFGGGLA